MFRIRPSFRLLLPLLVFLFVSVSHEREECSRVEGDETGECSRVEGDEKRERSRVEGDEEGECSRVGNREKEECTSSANHEKEKYSRSANDVWRVQLQNIEQSRDNYCECPQENCSCYRSNINADLAQFTESGVSETMVNKAREHGVLYQIIDGKLYRERECMFEMRCRGVEHFLLEVAYDLGGDVEFVINTRDWPMIRAGSPIPVFSFSKTDHYADIMYPAWSFWQGGPAISLYPTGLGRWDEHLRSLSASARAWPWHSRHPIAFFRGSRTSSERDSLVLLSRQRPHLFNASYTKNQAWRSMDDTLGAPPASEVALEQHCQYRYLFNYRGVAASFRFKHLFLCGSLVLHVGEEWREFFYDRLVPWYHYIPVRSDPTQQELIEVVEFARKHDDIVQEIASRGREFIMQNLRMEDVTCYWRELLIAYRKLLNYRPKRRKLLVPVTA